jgi:hypothetical protein
MKLFISWSGDRSHQIALKLQTWLPQVFPGIGEEIFVSSQLEKGISWFPRIVSELEGSNIGIICLTPENLHSIWLHFEAGALAKSISPPEVSTGAGSNVAPSSPRLYTYLHQVKPGQLTGPLAAYQSTTTVREDTERLMASLASHITSDQNQWRENFKAQWPDLEQTLRNLQIPIQELIPEFESLFQRKTFNEPLQHCTAQTWADRYDGARQTYEKLSANYEVVTDACPRYQADLCQKLLVELDGYTMNIKSLLLKAPPFDLNPSGELAIPAGILKACEDRRLRIKDILSSMLDPLNVPKVDDAVRFTECERFAQRKLLVHRKEKEIHQYKETLKSGRKREPGYAAIKEALKSLPDYLASSWDLDRIYYYLIQENLKPDSSSLEGAVTFVQMELETVRSRTDNPSLMPLHYSLRALSALIPSERVGDESATKVEVLLRDVEGFINESSDVEEADKKSERDKGRQVRTIIADIRTKMGTNTKTGSTVDQKSTTAGTSSS